MATIRPARPDDTGRIWEITKAAFGPYCIAKLLEDRFGLIDSRPWYEHKATEVADACADDPSKFIVAEEDGRVVGYASFFCIGDRGDVGNNAVDPACQGLGIGRALNRHGLEMLREQGVSVLTVQTLEHDTPARRIYEKHGFREGRRTVRYARCSEAGVELETVAASDAAAARRLEAEGFEQIATIVHYQMTLAELKDALGGSSDSQARRRTQP